MINLSCMSQFMRCKGLPIGKKNKNKIKKNFMGNSGKEIQKLSKMSKIHIYGSNVIKLNYI